MLDPLDAGRRMLDHKIAGADGPLAPKTAKDAGSLRFSPHSSEPKKMIDWQKTLASDLLVGTTRGKSHCGTGDAAWQVQLLLRSLSMFVYRRLPNVWSRSSF
jgi:hypothetical protein